MADRLNTLKAEIKKLEQIFHHKHERFQILTANVDELTCRFIGENATNYDIHASIMEYPSSPPFWYTDNDEISVTNALSILNTNGIENRLIKCKAPRRDACGTPPSKELNSDKDVPTQTALQTDIVIILRELCKMHNLPLPADAESLKQTLDLPAGDDEHHQINCQQIEEVESDLEEFKEAISDEGEYDDDNLLVETVVDNDADENADKPIVIEERNENKANHIETLEKVCQLQKEKNLKRGAYSTATEILMKELSSIYRSESFINKMYVVDLVENSLYNWTVQLMTVDRDSLLHKDLERLKKMEGEDRGILLNFMFKSTYPFEPPFVRIVYPCITGGYVLSGGAICLELLTQSGWSSAYCVEAILMQIAVTLVKGNARIQFEPTDTFSQNKYSLERAQQSFRSVERLHEKVGWYTPPKSDG